jgi:hypothetical protein
MRKPALVGGGNGHAACDERVSERGAGDDEADQGGC